MTDLGFTNKELSDSSYYGSPCAPCADSEKPEWEKQVVYPEMRFNGKVAEALGADDLELGEVLETTVRLRVKGLRDDGRVVDGKKKRDVEVRFELLAASDMTQVSKGDADEEGDEDEAPVDAVLP